LGTRKINVKSNAGGKKGERKKEQWRKSVLKKNQKCRRKGTGRSWGQRQRTNIKKEAATKERPREGWATHRKGRNGRRGSIGGIDDSSDKNKQTNEKKKKTNGKKKGHIYFNFGTSTSAYQKGQKRLAREREKSGRKGNYRRQAFQKNRPKRKQIQE